MVFEENQETNYRKIPALAFVSIGLASFSFLAVTNMFFWVLPVAGVLSGWSALRVIASAPDEWSGRRLAVAGISLAAILGGASLFYQTTRNWMDRRHSRNISDRFVHHFQQGNRESAFWLTVPKILRDQFLVEGQVNAENMQRYLQMYGRFAMKGDMDDSAGRNFDAEYLGIVVDSHWRDFRIIEHRYLLSGEYYSAHFHVRTHGQLLDKPPYQVWWVESHTIFPIQN